MATFQTQGVCAKQITFEVEEGIVKSLAFTGGCPGNLSAISRLVEGMPLQEVVSKLKGVTCGDKATSCADQLATALAEFERHA